MLTRIKGMAAISVLALLLAAAPAIADEGEEVAGGNSPLVMLLAGEFGMTEEEVQALADQGLGFGEIFKLTTLSIVLGTDIDTLLAGCEFDSETEEYECDFGELKQSLTEEQLALLGEFPKNFGSIVSAYNKAKHGDDHGKPDWAGEGKPEHAGNGKPPWAGEGDDDEEEEEEEGGEA